MFLAHAVQQTLRRGGEDDLDIGRAPLVLIDARADGFRDLADAARDEFRIGGTKALGLRTDGAAPARQLVRHAGGGGAGADEAVDRRLRRLGGGDGDAFQVHGGSRGLRRRRHRQERDQTQGSLKAHRS